MIYEGEIIGGVFDMVYKICIVYTTVNKEEDGKKLSEELVKNKLAACVSFTPVSSRYFWRGEIVTDSEFLLIIKTSISKKDTLVKWLKENHPYEVPEILIYEVEAHEEYFKWLEEYLK